MNIHPLIIHFPIACLILYSMVEITTGIFPQHKEKRHTTKLFLLIVGVIGTFFALASGNYTQELLGMEWSRLVNTHKQYGERTHITYLTILLYYFWRHILTHRIGQPYWKHLTIRSHTRSQYIINHTISKIIIMLLACIGMILLFITWALWWAISHGSHTDPIVSFIYNLIVK